MNSIKQIWNSKSEYIILSTLILLVIILSSISIYCVQHDNKQWQTFKQEHSCKIVGKRQGKTATGVAPIIGTNNNSGVGIIITTEPDQTGWLCDDGITYWR